MKNPKASSISYPFQLKSKCRLCGTAPSAFFYSFGKVVPKDPTKPKYKFKLIKASMVSKPIDYVQNLFDCNASIKTRLNSTNPSSFVNKQAAISYQVIYVCECHSSMWGFKKEIRDTKMLTRHHTFNLSVLRTSHRHFDFKNKKQRP